MSCNTSYIWRTRENPEVNAVIETRVGDIILTVRILKVEFGDYTRTETVEVLQAPEGHNFPQIITIKRLGGQRSPERKRMLETQRRTEAPLNSRSAWNLT
ncbi:unnamed protein product [Clonostachys rosea]|uniref:Uncharacterized protein n=1 Tax=Bionectria ochroleuca TaxID=29856 RepID=A0ABY6V3H2_BIOOC|nr:unnamed protein product [Clonostachys rosea]